MMPAATHPTIDAEASSVSPRMVVASIAGFWAFYFVVSTVRTAMEGERGQLSMLGPRLLVSLVSIGATAILYMALRRVAGGSLRRSMITALIASIPAAAVYGATNWVLFERVMAALRQVVPAFSTAHSITVGISPVCEMPTSPLVDIASTAINGYFFMVTWCALFLALSYAAKLAAVERRSATLSASAQAAELRALRYQVNPHFLFNTMNSLSSLVMANRNPEADRMIVGLSTFFRASLMDDPTHDVALSEEIALQRLYLEIEAVRFGDRLHVAIEVAPEVEKACVPGLILQPLVENVIKHALSRTRRTVTLSIRAREDAGRLRLEVCDDGDGTFGGEEAEPGVGLTNVRDRMAARFGPAGSVEWRSGGDGFTVVLDMPLSREGC